MCVALSSGDFTTDPTLSALSDHWPGYENNDSRGCVCRRVVVLCSQEKRSCPEERVRSPEISHKITAHFQDLDFSSGPIVSETICGALEKESGVAKYAKHFERIVCKTINYNV